MRTHIDKLLRTTPECLGGEVPGPIVLSSRIRLARNFHQYPFPGWAKEEQRREILAYCRNTFPEIPALAESTALEIASLTELERQVLVERHLMSRELSKAPEGAGIFITPDQTCAIMVNEEDHLRIQVLRAGFRLKTLWKTIDALDTALESRIHFAFSPEFGYLTACPTNVGTGMRASVMMHLPGLVLISQMDKTIRAVNQIGMAVRGVLGEGSEASGSVFQISNQQTLGESEEEILRRLIGVLKTIISHENNARQRLLEASPHKLLDKIGRAYGTLRNGHILSSSEAMNHLSLLRMAIDLGMLPAAHRPLVDRLFVACQPGHVQLNAEDTIPSEKRDIVRASLLRENFAQLPPLDFDKIVP